MPVFLFVPLKKLLPSVEDQQKVSSCRDREARLSDPEISVPKTVLGTWKGFSKYFFEIKITIKIKEGVVPTIICEMTWVVLTSGVRRLSILAAGLGEGKPRMSLKGTNKTLHDWTCPFLSPPFLSFLASALLPQQHRSAGNSLLILYYFLLWNILPCCYPFPLGLILPGCLLNLYLSFIMFCLFFWSPSKAPPELVPSSVSLES